MGLPRECCDIKKNITANTQLCENILGGAYDLRIACFKDICYTEVPCDWPYEGLNTPTYPYYHTNGSDSVLTSWSTFQLPGYIDWLAPLTDEGLCYTWYPCMGQSPTLWPMYGQEYTPRFYKISVRDKTLEHTWGLTYDNDTGSLGNSENVLFQVDVKDKDFYCTIKDYIGQEVVVLFREKGSDRWYLVGYTGGLVFTSISGGTGSDTFTPTSFEITSTNSKEIFKQVLFNNPLHDWFVEPCGDVDGFEMIALLSSEDYTTYMLDLYTVD